jgi:hypothetical protein
MATVPRLRNSYDLYENLSFFQKSIREGKLEQALYWGYYLFLEENYATAAFRRMRIITHEDIGLANLEAIVIIDSLHKLWNEKEWGKRDKILWLAGVKYLCKSYKNKENDWFLIIGKKMMDIGGWKPKERIQLEECIKNRDEKSAFYIAFHLKEKDHIALWDIFKGFKEDQVVQACQNSYAECMGRKGGDGFLCLPILYLCRRIEFREIDCAGRIEDILADVEDIESPDEFKPTIPEHYWDMHTYKGRSKARGFVHWLENCKPHPYIEVPGEKHRINSGLAKILEKKVVIEIEKSVEQAKIEDFSG